MTISTTSNTTIAQGNGLTTSFDFPFPVPTSSDLDVYFTNAAGVTVLLAPSQYTVTGIGTADGGSVGYPISGSPIPSGTFLTIQRVLPYVQLTDLVNQSGFYPNVVENALDYLTMLIQQLEESSSLSLQVPLSSSVPNLVFPGTTARAGQLAGFDAQGNAITYPVTASVGAGNLTPEGPFVANVGFTPNVTTTLTLSQAYGTAANVQVFFDGTHQGIDQYSLNGNQIIFTSPIPLGIQKVYIIGGTTLSANIPANGSVGPAQFAPAYGPTSARPVPVQIGQRYTDTTLGYDVVCTSLSPVTWENVSGAIPMLNVLTFGADPTGAAYSDAAVTAALAACPAGRAYVYFPPGKYNFQFPINYTFPNNHSSITLAGAGSEVTELTCALAGYPVIGISYLGPLNSAHIRDMTITSQYAGGGNNGILLNQTLASIPNPASSALSTIENVTIRGSDGYQATNYFSEGVLVQGVSNINFTNLVVVGDSGVHGQGVQLTGTASALGVAYNFVGCYFIGNGNGIYYGQYIQGVTCTACNFLCVNGILVPGGNLPGLDQLYVGASQFNCINNAILLQSPINAVMLIGNFVLVTPNGSGFVIQNVAQFVISSNTFNPGVLPITNATGIAIGTYDAWGGIITTNQFVALTIAISLQTGSQFVNVQSNSYSGNGTNVLNNGTNNTVGGGSQ